MSEKKPDTTRELEKKLGVKFKDKSLLEIALLHRSYSSQHNISKDNERLEFLGDSVLNAAVSRMLFEKFPEKDEGQLTKIRARLVSGRALKKWGKQLELEKYVLLGDQAKKHAPPGRTKIVENTLEAIVGAMFLDRGFEDTYKYIKNQLQNRDFHRVMDFKSLLQELSVELFDSIPEYETLSHGGPPHRKVFKVQVKVEGRPMGEGTGRSKKEAHQAAAKEAYKKIKQED